MELKHTLGEWKIRKTVDESGDYPFPTYDILAIHEYGPEGIGTAYQNPYNARLFSCSKEMLEVLIENYTTYEVLKEIFEKQNPMLWSMIQGAYLLTPKNTKELIEKVTGLTIEEVMKNE